MTLPLLAAVLLFAAPQLAVAAPAADPVDFSRLFLAGDDEAIDAMMTFQMKSAFSGAQRTQIRSGLAQQYGAPSRFGQAWKEDRVQGFDRFRVPVFFEDDVLDLRIVVDGKGRIAGFFIVPHVDREAFEDPEGGPETELGVIVGDGRTGLPGLLTLPEGSGPFPGVVLFHGSGPSDMDETVGFNKPFRDLAWGLSERGVAVLRYHKRSYARPEDLAALGDALTVREEVVTDAHAALKTLRGHQQIDPGRVFVLGHSLGGTLAPWIASTAEPRPAGVIVLAGMTLPMPEKMLEQMRYLAELDGTIAGDERLRLEQVEAGVKALRAALDGEAEPPSTQTLGAPFKYFESLEERDPPAEAAALGLPVFVLQGTRDYQVTMKDFALWQTALAERPGACLKAYDGLDHLFRHGTGPSNPQDYERPAPMAPAVLDDLAAWIGEWRCPRPRG